MTTLPQGSWDTHCHIFSPDTHPYSPDSPYFPPPRSVSQLLAASPTFNFVIVMSVPEGTDVDLNLTGIRELTSEGRKGRGTAVLDWDATTLEQFQSLHTAGVRSVRIHEARAKIKFGGGVPALIQFFELVAERVSPLGWSIDAQLPLPTWVAIAPCLRRLHAKYGTLFVVDHMFCATEKDIGGEDLKSATQLIIDGIAYVKLSGLERFRDKSLSTGLEGLRPMVEGYLKAMDGDRVLFGSDWPHVITTGVGGCSKVDLEVQLEFLKSCCDGVGPRYWEKLMVKNPEKLYL